MPGTRHVLGPAKPDPSAGHDGGGGDGPGHARHPSRLAEPVIGPRLARTRWLAPQDDGKRVVS